VRQFLDEVVNGGNLRAIGQLWAEDLAWHGGSLGDIHGLAALKAHTAASASSAFTGMHLTVKDIMAAGNKVAVRFTNGGTQAPIPSRPCHRRLRPCQPGPPPPPMTPSQHPQSPADSRLPFTAG